MAESLNVLTKGAVSAHYLVPATGGPSGFTVFQLLGEDRVAYHAGISHWGPRSRLNDNSIGVEIVNSGYREGAWEPYPPDQIAAVTELCQSIARRHSIIPSHILGHSDVAPDRKRDPGPAFPWHLLHKNGVGAWYSESDVSRFKFDGSVHNTRWLQKSLKTYGYRVEETGVLDEQTRCVVRAFQAHFQADSVSGDNTTGGTPNERTFAIVNSLLRKYKG